jgi:hypothetical protein
MLQAVQEVFPSGRGQRLGPRVSVASYEHCRLGNLLRVVRFHNVNHIEAAERRKALVPPHVWALRADAGQYTARTSLDTLFSVDVTHREHTIPTCAGLRSHTLVIFITVPMFAGSLPSVAAHREEPLNGGRVVWP